MSLSSLLESDFSTDAVESGNKLFRRGQVEITYSSNDQLMALVNESGQRQVVVIDVTENDTGVGCTCATFRTDDLCSHLWGVILAATEQETLEGVSEANAEILSLLDEEVESLRLEMDSLIARQVRKNDTTGREVSHLRRVRPTIRQSASGSARSWREGLEHLGRSTRWSERQRGSKSRGREAYYVVNGRKPEVESGFHSPFFTYLRLDIGYRDEKKNGELGALKFYSIRPEMIAEFRSEEDRRILSFLEEVCDAAFSPTSSGSKSAPTSYEVPAALAPILFDMIAPTGRLLIHDGNPEQNSPVDWVPDEYWTPEVRIEPVERDDKSDDQVGFVLYFHHGNRNATLNSATYLATGLLRVADRIVRVTDTTIDPVVDHFYGFGSVSLPAADLPTAMSQLEHFGRSVRLSTAAGLPVSIESPPPEPRISFRTESQTVVDHVISGELTFDYSDISLPPSDSRSGVWSGRSGRFLQRDRESEKGCFDLLNELGFRQSQERSASERDVWNVPKKRFVRAVSELIDRGWTVEAQGRSYRTAGSVEVTVSSGQDWFDIDGLASFGEATLPFPELLRAIRGGERFVMLDDGTYGLIPEEWTERYGGLAAKFNTKEGVLRFRSNQTVLLDLLLDEMPEVSFDDRFIGARQKLDSFSGITPQAPPRTFRGELRPYQQMALGWFSFLREFGLGGCLADDMGLGKTVQVLALLEERRRLKIGRPSLAVVPKSLIFNWMREAERFTPKLRTLDYTGILRSAFADRLDDYDLVLTTYGTLRRDIAELREIRFDYVILDESQAIKNPLSATAKAVRLLQGDHRLAMSGTPIENRIEELWSLFEFLNPGMLGSSKAFARLMEPQTEEETRQTGRRSAKIGRVLRPFILRRTKQAVAPELPERVEQTIFCELGGTQRRLYNELLDYIRNEVMGEVLGKGIGKSSLKILEGLLRLRQAASHPGLLDPKRKSAGCAKFDVLIPRLSELAAEGHKVLVFSQFTSLLEILKGELVEEGLTFEYLDGKTRDRQACVDRFQNSPEIPLFLISLKAGGVGLNLTAASYVYLLDPWWNPAVEAQAIDRTHRIGQKNTVVASRLIARDTIEEKVLALQQQKRELADSIITGENSLIRDLSREDLEMLLG